MSTMWIQQGRSDKQTYIRPLATRLAHALTVQCSALCLATAAWSRRCMRRRACCCTCRQLCAMTSAPVTAAAAQIALPSRHGRPWPPCHQCAQGRSCAPVRSGAHAGRGGGCAPIFPFDGPLGAGLAGTWERIFDNAAGMWPAGSSALAPAIVHDMQRHDHLVMTWRRTMAMQVCARLPSRT
jgi:hypothetical protein